MSHFYALLNKSTHTRSLQTLTRCGHKTHGIRLSCTYNPHSTRERYEFKIHGIPSRKDLIRTASSRHQFLQASLKTWNSVAQVAVTAAGNLGLKIYSNGQRLKVSHVYQCEEGQPLQLQLHIYNDADNRDFLDVSVNGCLRLRVEIP